MSMRTIEADSRLQEIACNRTFCWIGRRRGLLISLGAAILGLHALFWSRAQPVDFLGPDSDRHAPWLLALVLLGVVVRAWGAGNLRKNQEVTQTGIYRMLRHPLYLGNLLIYLAFFLSFGNPLLGAALFLVVLIPVHYPLMLQEEARLARDRPGQFEAYSRAPRLLPNLLALPAALKTDRFSARQAWRNRAARSAFALVLLPLAAESVRALQKLL